MQMETSQISERCLKISAIVPNMSLYKSKWLKEPFVRNKS